MKKGKLQQNRKSSGKGTLFVISAPSGAGKTTLCQRLLKHVSGIEMSVSYTTRKPRKGERNKIDYTFVSRKRFMSMIDNGEFAEWATVHGNLYGTSLKELKRLNDKGYDIILDIDSHGALQMKRTYKNAVYVFVLPPSMNILEKRLKNRKTDSDETIATRLGNAKSEIASYENYDYIIINDRLDEAYRELESIVLATRLRTARADHAWIKSLIT